MNAQMIYWEKQLSEAEEKIESLSAERADLAGKLAEETELHKEEWRRAQALGNEVERLRNERARISTRLATFEVGYKNLSDANLDLAAKLEQAQAELHELRIAVGLGEHWRRVEYGEQVGSFALVLEDGHQAIRWSTPRYNHFYYLPDDMRVYRRELVDKS